MNDNSNAQHLDSARNFLPSHEEHNQPSIPPMISGTLNEAGVINGEALEELSWDQSGNAMFNRSEDLSVATTDAPHAMDPYSISNNGDCFASSVNDPFRRYPYHDLCDTITEYGAMSFSPVEPPMQRSETNMSAASTAMLFSPAEPPMQRSETNVSAASTAWLESNTQLNPLYRETRGQPETETANVSNLELGDLPSNSEAASLTRRSSKGKKGLNRKRCRYCKESFRGNHERERHRKAKHATCVKRFVCRDPPTEAGTVSKLSVIQPLSECKVCVVGKEYNRDDNAGQHLRKHFTNKPNSVKEPGGEKRGGMGDQDQDPKIRLNDLRPWIVGFTVNLGEDCEAPNDKEL
ncbi:hypothetical protein E4U50_008097 [Claviceps purpurea]|nr:hypothetical protein E4U50_008097 [Claviceps purpurea]